MKNNFYIPHTIKLIFVFLLFFSFIINCTSGTGESTIVYNEGITIEQGKLRITQYGISWLIERHNGTPYAEGDSDYGQFANGDYWVVGPVRLISISPGSKQISGRTMNGSMVNPVPGNQQGYDSAVTGTYSAALNVGAAVSASTPLVLQDGTSLVSSISLDNPESGMDRPKLKIAAVLTILTSAPDSGSFRPPYCGTDKTVRFNISQLNYTLLENLDPVANTPSLPDMERKFERVWLDHIGGWIGRALHPVENMPDYGAIIAGEVSEGALMLHLNFTNEQKRTLLIRYTQLGIDNFGIIQSGGRTLWEPDGGHCGGRKWTILFAGMILNDTRTDGMKNIGQKSGDYLYTGTYGPGNVPPDYIHFQEDCQTFYVTQADIDITDHYYPPDHSDLPEYTASDTGMPEWGIRHSTYPSWDGNAWNVTYRIINAYSWGGVILSARIMNANTPELWNHPAIFEYEDRHMAVTAPDNLIPAWRYSTYSTYTNNNQFIQDVWASEAGHDYSWRATSRFIENMWDEYRDNF